MVRQVELPDPLVEAVVDEAVREVQEEVSVHRPEDLLDAHPIVEDAVEHGVADFVVVQGAGFHARGADAEGRATVAPGPVFAVGDVEIRDLLVGDGTDLTVKDILALTQLATSGAWGLARGAFQGYGANVGILHLHGLRVRGTWLGNHISQHAGFNFRCQEQLWNNITLSASARSLGIFAFLAVFRVVALFQYVTEPGDFFGQNNLGSSGGSVQALKKVDMLAQSNVASSTPFRLETQHVHQLVVPCVRDSGIQLHSDSLRWRNHPLCHRPGEKTVVLLVLRLVGSTPTWSNRENVSNPPHRTQTRGHSLRGSARPLRVLRSDPTGRDWVCG